MQRRSSWLLDEEQERPLENLGQAKVDILHGSVTRFVDTFGKIHHVELADSVGMDELSELEVNEDTLKEMGELGSLAAKMASRAPWKDWRQEGSWPLAPTVLPVFWAAVRELPLQAFREQRPPMLPWPS